MRLDKLLSSAGYGTRSEVKKIIRAGSVSVNSAMVKDCGFILDENKDIVCVNGHRIDYRKDIYILLYKPEGYVCSNDVPGERSFTELIDEPNKSGLFTVGRLDKDTTGLLLITNDGKLSHSLLSPSKHVDKTYLVGLKSPAEENYEELLNNGIDIGDDKPTLPAVYEKVDDYRCLLTIHEGRFHQVKRMFASLGNEVISLKRIRMKNLVLDEAMKPGDYRYLTEEELKELKDLKDSKGDK